jgi:hypothetical protein
MEAKLSANILQRKPQGKFLDIPSAALEAGYSTRHFKRIIDEDSIPTQQIGEKFFILSQDLAAWKETKGEARFDHMIQQLDIWLQQIGKDAPEPIDFFEDED